MTATKQTITALRGLVDRTNEAMNEAAADIAERPHINKPRKVVLAISIKPEVDKETGIIQTITTCTVKAVLPPRELSIVHGIMAGETIRIDADDPLGPATVQPDMIDPKYNQKIQMMVAPAAATGE
jgi:hypothetical protein